MLADVHVFRSPSEVSGIYDTLFGGLYAAKAIPALTQLSILSLILVAIALAHHIGKERRPVLGRLFSLCVIANFFLMCMLTLQPWDELFVNLRHAKHFAEVGLFSFNRGIAVEGTVDFLPYFTLGLLHKLGLPLVEGAILMSVFGGVLCLWAGRQLLRAWKNPFADTWGLLAISLFPPILYNSSQGFSAAVFTGWLMTAAYFTIFTPQKRVGILLAAVLPLIRIEGVWFTLLLSLYARLLVPGILALVPTLLLSAWRFNQFGSPVPIPIQYKNTMGSLFYLLIGIRNFLSDFIASYGLSSLLVILLCLHERREKKSRKAVLSREQWTFLALCALFVVPYYISGGDWFPPHWGRYLLPLSFALFLLAFHSFSWAMENLEGIHQTRTFVHISLIVLIPALWSQSGMRRWISDIFPPRRFLAKTVTRHSPHSRLQLLSQLGNHLKNSTPENYVVGSSEVATIMYFAEREALDLLGIANPDVASQPLRTSPPIIRRYARSELPYSIFRRVNPEVVEKKRPEVLYLFDFSIRDLYEDLAPWEVSDEMLHKALSRWERKFHGLIAPIYGSVAHLIELGYVPIVAFSGPDFANLYLVHQSAMSVHTSMLVEDGFTHTTIQFPFGE